MIPVYQAGGQLIKVRGLMILSLVCLASSFWYGLDLAQSYGLNPGDGGVLAPLPQRLAVAGIVASLGIAFAAGMWLYGRRYAARIDFDPDSRQIHLDTVGLVRPIHHVIDIADLSSVGARHDINWGVVAAATVLGHPVPLVDAPWRSVRITGWRLPLIIDEKGSVHHPRLMRILFAGGT